MGEGQDRLIAWNWPGSHSEPSFLLARMKISNMHHTTTSRFLVVNDWSVFCLNMNSGDELRSSKASTHPVGHHRPSPSQEHFQLTHELSVACSYIVGNWVGRRTLVSIMALQCSAGFSGCARWDAAQLQLCTSYRKTERHRKDGESPCMVPNGLTSVHFSKCKPSPGLP